MPGIELGQVTGPDRKFLAARAAAQDGEVGAFDRDIGPQAFALVAQGLEVGVEGMKQAFQRLAAQAVQGGFKLAAGTALCRCGVTVAFCLWAQILALMAAIICWSVIFAALPVLPAACADLP